MKHLDAFSVPLAGIHLIEASAGTGKTHAITTLYLRAVVEGGWRPEQILVVTFTRAATGELRERVRQRLRAAWNCLQSGVATDSDLAAYLERQPSRQSCLQRLERALLLIDQAAVMTIHGFCGRVLEQYAFENRLAFNAELIESADALCEEIVNDFVVTHLAQRSELELLALRSIGIDTEALRQLARPEFTLFECQLEPEPNEGALGLLPVLESFECHRRRAVDWLERPDSTRYLARLNKTKPPAMLGKRLAGYVERARAWLTQPFYRLKTVADAFEKIRSLAQKYPDANGAELTTWLSELAACEQSFGDLRRCILELGVQVRRDCLLYVSQQLERQKTERNLQTYDDLLRGLRNTLAGTGGEALASRLSAQYPCAMIDEFQDTDPVQFDLFARIYGREATLFLIGDPKQSIYAFRGADVDNYLLAKQNPRVECHTLEVNWRSDPGLVRGLELLYAGHRDPFMGAGIDYVSVRHRLGAQDLVVDSDRSASGVRLLWLQPEGAGSGRRMFKYEAHQLAQLATVAHIRSLLTTTPKGWPCPVRASDIAVLARTNQQCRALSQALRKYGIRCIQTSETGVLGSDAADTILGLMHALLAPNDVRQVTRLLASPLFDVEPRKILSYRDDSGRWEDLVRRLGEYRALWVRSGILAVLVRICNELEVRRRVLRFDYGERLVTDLFHVAELVQAVSRRRHLTLEAQLDWLDRARQGEHEFSIEEQQLRIEADSDAVVITTVHRSKGLQFPFVVCPLLWDADARRAGQYLEFRRPTPGGGKRRVVHLAPELLGEASPERQWVEQERMQESARLLYVAMTRAKHQVAVMLGAVVGLESSAIGQLLWGATGGHERPSSAAPEMGTEWHQHFEQWCASDALCFEDWSAPRATDGLVTSSVGSSLVKPKPLRRAIQATLRVTSYSALTAGAESEVALGRDVDAIGDETTRDAMAVQGSDRADSSLDAELTLLELPPGPRTGEALHKILELADFSKFGATSPDVDIAAILGRYGLDAKRWREPVGHGIRKILDVELVADDHRFRLASVPLGRRKSELQFSMTISGLDVGRLSACLGSELTGIDAYASDAQRLKFDPVTGLLRGFIDLVFEVEGRYYVADYKSNYLGDHAEDYAAARLGREMRRHHYPVQAAIYAAAIDRWLRLNLTNYDFASHFGGVFYLFLRGMTPALGSSNGVFFHRPTLSSIRRFQATLEGKVA